MADLYLYGAFGSSEELRAAGVVKILERLKNKPEITVSINSLGGDVTEGMGIYSALSSFRGRVVVEIAGVAASMASAVAMAGNRIRIVANGLLMLHNPWMSSNGDAAGLRKASEMLDKFGASLVSMYAKRTGLSDARIDELMNAETWLTADEALHMGFVDEIVEAIPAARVPGLIAALAGIRDFKIKEDDEMKTVTLSTDELDAKLAAERAAGRADAQPEVKAAYDRGKAEAIAADEKARTDAAGAADKAKADAATAAAKQERERVTAIQALGAKNPGHEALIAEMVADGQTTLEQAKARLHDANDAKRTARLDALKTGAPKPLAAPPAPPDGRDRAQTYNPAQVGAQARIWRQEQLRAGRPCTAQEAMDHVLAEAGLPVGSALLESLQQQA